MRMQQVLQLLHNDNSKALYFHKDSGVHHIFLRVFVDNKVFIAYVNGTSNKNKILEARL